MKRYIIIFLIAIIPYTLFSQKDSINFSEITRSEILNMTYEQLMELPFSELLKIAQKLGITIDELLKMKTSVASKTELTPRESPGIVSIVTSEEISQSGARDLIEVLRLVPGINFAYDDAGIIGINMRGNWGHEGKVLLIIDGQEMNELKYNTLQFGRHFDVSQIKKIEIIRGPGSSIYGGSAELGVINIITHNASSINGVKAYSSYSQMGNEMGFGSIGLSAGAQTNDFEVVAHGNISQGIKSNKMYFYRDMFDLGEEGSDVVSRNINLGLKKNDLSLRFIYDYHQSDFIYGLTDTSAKVFKQSFASYLGEIKYDLKVNKKLLITPKLNVKNNLPYYKDYSGVLSNTSISRYSGNVLLKYVPNNNIDIIGGIEYFYDYGKMTSDDANAIFDNGKKSLSYNTISAYTQGIVKTKLANLIIGGRFDQHNAFGAAYAPRVGLTKIWNNFHFKVLYSGAYRSPSIGNLLKSKDLEPEKTYVAELELGYKINSNMFVTANLFNIDINNPIVWGRVADSGYYYNGTKTGSYGFELEYRLKYTRFFTTLNYSYYNINQNTVLSYGNEFEPSVYKAAPAHKISLLGSVNISKSISVAPSLIYSSMQYGSPILLITEKSGPNVIANFYVHCNKVFIKNLELSVGVSNIFENAPTYLQAYIGEQLFFPSPSREFSIKFSYRFLEGIFN